MDSDYHQRMPNGLTIYDTTLRDGAQGEGVHFSLSDKLRLAEKLAAYGIHYVEGGWPGSNDKDRLSPLIFFNLSVPESLNPWIP